jgi:hypothetical protein
MDGPVKERATLRFAVGIFDAWADAQASVLELATAETTYSSFNFLGLHRVLAPVAAREDSGMLLLDLPFPANRELIVGTSGPVANGLADRLTAKADSLGSALGLWLIPRHAAHLEQAVIAGKIVLFVQLFDDDGERRACRSLLARSSNSVGVHDMVGP